MNRTPSAIPARLLNVPAAARYVGIGKSGLWDRVRAGEIPHVRIGARVLIDRADLDKLIEAAKSTTWASVPRRHSTTSSSPTNL